MPKRILPLSESQVETAQPQSKDYKLSDGFGLHLLVTTAGARLWRFQYRYMGKQKLLALGAYPTVSLTDAREKREEARKHLAQRLDPSALKKKQRDPEGPSFEVVVRKWHERYKPQWSARHARGLLIRLQFDVFPFIGSIPIREVNASDLLDVLRRIQMRTLVTAARIKTAFVQIFRYAVETGLIGHNPTESLRGALPPIKRKHLAPPADTKAIASLLLAIDGYEGAFVVKCNMQLAPLLLVDPRDLCHAEWEEIDFQGESWNIPAQKTDLAQARIVPLARQALEILRRLSLSGHNRYVFPSLRSSRRCMSVNAINAALGSMGLGNDELDGRKFGQVARSALTEEAKVSIDVIEVQLSHKTKLQSKTNYDPTLFLSQRCEMMQRWADYLDDLKERVKDAAST